MWLFLILAVAILLLVSAWIFRPLYIGTIQKGTGRFSAFVIVAALSLLMAGASGMLYYTLGEPQLLTRHWLASPVGEPQLEQLLGEVEKKIEEDTDNPEAWLILARGQMMLQDYPKAIESLQTALKLTEDSSEIIVLLADARTMNNNGEVDDQALQLLFRAYHLDPVNQGMLWMLAIANEQRDNNQEAVRYWQELEQVLTDEPELQQQVGQQIRRLSLPQFGYQLNISLAPNLFEQHNPEATVFIFASETGGSPMPIAATRISATELPKIVILDNVASLSIERPLSSITQVTVTARISTSGQPQAQQGDVFGRINLSNDQFGTTHMLEMNQVHNN